MRGDGYADVLPVLQVPDNKADAVPCERLQEFYPGLPVPGAIEFTKEYLLPCPETQLPVFENHLYP